MTTLQPGRRPDGDTAGWRAFLLCWHRVHGDARLTAKQLWDSPGLGIGHQPWTGTFPFPTGGRPTVSLGCEPVKSLGRWLAAQVDRWHTDVVLRSAFESHVKYRVYWVHRHTAESVRDGGS